MGTTCDFSPIPPRVASPARVSLSLISIITDQSSCLNLVQSLFHLKNTPGLISLLVGKPNPETFPFTSLSFTAKSPLENGQDVTLTLTLDNEDLVEGLQYNTTVGLPRLFDWLRGLQERQHGRRKDEGWDIAVGTGSRDLIYKVNFFPNILATVNVRTGHHGDGESRRLCAS